MAVACPSARTYTRRTPEQTVLYRVVEHYLPAFVAHSEAGDQGGRLPAFVRCEFVLGVGLRLLTAVQTWRVLGGMFLFLYAFNLRPALFAFPAGLGDVAVGVAAVFVLGAMIEGHPNWRRRVLLLNLGGLVRSAPLGPRARVPAAAWVAGRPELPRTRFAI
jgi:hypothetical protein